jgi:hypothetical protein
MQGSGVASLVGKPGSSGRTTTGLEGRAREREPRAVDEPILTPPVLRAPAPVPFTSTYGWSGRSTPGSVEAQADGTIVSTGVGWMFDSRDASDPRFAGPLVLTMTDIEYPEVGGSVAVGGYRVETADGAWQQTPEANLAFEEDYFLWESGALPPAGNIQFWTFIGEDDYAGLTAVVQETWANGTVQFDGYIFEGDLWEAPEPWVP